MTVEQFNIDAWFSRIGHNGSREPTLANQSHLRSAMGRRYCEGFRMFNDPKRTSAPYLWPRDR
jgi:hypothetical protein